MTELQQTGYATLDGISQSGNDLVKFICNVLPSFYIVSYVMTLPLPCHAGSVAFCTEKFPVTCSLHNGLRLTCCTPSSY